MGRFLLIGTLLLLFVASLRSQDPTEKSTASDEATESDETFVLASTGSPSVKQLEVATLATSADSGVNTIRAAKAEVPSVKQLEVAMLATSADSGVNTIRAAKAEALPSQEPSTTSSDATSTAVTTEHIKVQNESLTTVPTTFLSGQPTTFKTVDLPTLPSGGEVDESEIPADNRAVTDLPTTNNETDGKDFEGDGTPTVPGTENEPEDNGFTKATTTSTAKRPGQDTNKDKKASADAKEAKRRRTIILIIVLICILVLLLTLMVFFMLRKRKRSGSFRTNSKKKAKHDVWAGQVPELGEGKATQEVAENGTAGNGPEATNEEEMITFVSGEKKADSMVEMNELRSEANGGEKLPKEAAEEEKTPLLEEASEVSPKPNDTEEFFPAPPVEQELMANGV